MAYTYSGSLSIGMDVLVTASGDPISGNMKLAEVFSAVLAASGGTAPTVSGFLAGTFVAAAGDLLLAHATDPLGSMGSETYSAGFTVASSKLKVLAIRNNDATNTVTIVRAAANGLPIFAAAGDGTTLDAGGFFLWHNKAGTAALTTGSNDALTISVGGGTPSCDIVAIYGP
jgi:hypothetical protein